MTPEQVKRWRHILASGQEPEAPEGLEWAIPSWGDGPRLVDPADHQNVYIERDVDCYDISLSRYAGGMGSIPVAAIRVLDAAWAMVSGGEG